PVLDNARAPRLAYARQHHTGDKQPLCQVKQTAQGTPKTRLSDFFGRVAQSGLTLRSKPRL
ncbi:MAG: hypothetical protein ACREUA_08845, partial [Burkholderiales bacterium]